MGSITFEGDNLKHWHDGAGGGRCSKATVKTQLITAYGGTDKWNKLAKGVYSKKGKFSNFDFFFQKNGEIYVMPHGEKKGHDATGIMWKDLEVMKK